MLASLSIIVNDGLGFHPFYKGPEYINAVQSHYFVDPYPRNFWLGLILACGFVEIAVPDRTRAPGDIGFDPLDLKPKKADEFIKLQNRELNNGRLAMIAMAGIYAQELLGYKLGEVLKF